MRVPVLDPQGSPLMPTKPSRARRWLRDGKAVVVHNDLNIFCIQLVAEPSGHETQEIAVAIDPGKLWSGVGLVSSGATLFAAHLILPFKSVTQKMTARRILRHSRRGRRIDRKIAYHFRAHRQERFDNRRQNKLPPSIRSNRLLELRVVKELLRIFPVSHIVYEVVKARGDKGFSPVMVGQAWMLKQLEQLLPTTTQEGWQTSILRQQLGLIKDKTDKSLPKLETHAVDGIALAASHFMSFEKFHTTNIRGHHWVGQVNLTAAPLKIIARPNIYRRQLHFENPTSDAPNHRKRKGGTITPWGFRSGDYVEAIKAGKTHRGWIGGYSEVNKVVSLYNHDWKRIGQFSVSKTKLLSRSNGLCVA